MGRFGFLKLGDSQNHTLNHRFQYQVMIEFWWFEATPFQETAVSFTNKPWRIRMEHRQFFGKTSKTWDLTMNSGYLTSNHVYLMIVRWGVAPGIFWVLSKGYNGGCDKTYIKLQVRQNIHKASGAKICQSTRLEGFCGTWNSPQTNDWFWCFLFPATSARLHTKEATYVWDRRNNSKTHSHPYQHPLRTQKQ